MKYDSIIIGSGISGIVAAIKLTVAGKKTLLLEKEEIPGGYFSGFENSEGDKFDYAVSYVLSCGEGDVVWNFLSEIGLEDRIRFKKLSKTDDIYISDKHICFSNGREAFEKELYDEFPDSKYEINELIKWLINYQEGLAVQGKTAIKFFMNYFRKDFEEFINQKISNKMLRAVLALRIQADPASLMIMAGFIVECYFKGMFYPEGGTMNFINSLIRFYIEKGGVLLTDEAVEFNKENGKIVSVVTAKNIIYEADTFVFNGDLISLNNNLLNGEVSDLTKKRVNGRVIGHSSLSIFLTVTNLDLSLFDGGRVYLTNSDDIFETYRQIEKGEIPLFPVIKLHFPCNYDDKLSSRERKLIRIETDIYYNEEKDNQEKYQKYADSILDFVAEKLLPSLHEHIVYKRIITPVEWKEKFGHIHGSGTGWAHTTYNMMEVKYPQKTDYNNLFITGQWGEYGSGLRQLILSAEKTVEYVLKYLENNGR